MKPKSKDRTWLDLGGEGHRRRISTKGTTKARVFPEPVAASTATSLWPQRRGMVAAWTGVQKRKPPRVRVSRTGSESEGRRSEKRVVVRARLGASDLSTAIVGGGGVASSGDLKFSV